MQNAKKFLRENPTESQAVAAKIFNVNSKSLSASIKRGSDEKKEEHNKMLEKLKKHASNRSKR
jgi:hypothetical protein